MNKRVIGLDLGVGPDEQRFVIVEVYPDGRKVVLAVRKAMDNQLYQWVIYEHPKDAPDKFIVRRWACLPEPRPCGAGIGFDTLDEAREFIWRAQPGLVCLPRTPQDDPVIVEVWT